MYCSSCGSTISIHTIYCNRCGAKIPSELASSNQVPDSLVWAIVAAFVGGTGVIIGLMAVMKEVVGFDHGIIMAIAFLSFFALFIIEGVLLSMLIGSMRRKKDSSEPAQLPSRATRELEEARQQMINEPGSVTEGTTRTFEPVYSERKYE